MPSWKRIIVSGSNAELGSIYATGAVTASIVSASQFTGSLFGTASWAYSSSQALTASYLNPLTQSVFITGGLNLVGNQTITGSILITGSIEMNSPTASISGVDYIDFDTSYIVGTDAPAWKEGRLFYDSGSGALAFYNWEEEVTLNIGQEQWLRARNDSGQVVPNGTPVRITGAAGDKPNFDLAQAVDQVNTFSSANDIIGVTTQEIGIGETGFVTTFGIVNGLDTQTPGWSAGDILWVSQSAGELTTVAPQAPYDKIFVGIVTRVNPNNGSIFVRCEPPFHFHDISSVSASAYTYGDVWMFKASGSSGVWTNTKTLSGSYTLSGSLTTDDGVSVQSLTASFVSASSITGSLFGTSSWAYSSSQALTASYGNITGSLFGTSSWAYSSSQALTASYVNLLAGPNITINYQTNGIAITGSGGGTPGGTNKTIQFNDSSTFSGSTNFTFDKSTNEVQLTGSLIVSGSGTFRNIGPAVFTGSFVVVDPTGELAIEIDDLTRKFYDHAGIISADTRTRILYDINTTSSVDWGSRILTTDDGTGNTITTVDWGNEQLNDIDGKNSVDWNTRELYNSTPALAANWEKGWLIDPATNVPTVKWTQATLLGLSTSQSINWDSRLLQASDQSTAIDWDSRLAYYANQTHSIDWAGGRLYDVYESASIEWTNRYLYDKYGNLALQYRDTGSSDQVRLYGTSSYALTASFLPADTYNITASWAESASQALTASYINPLNQNVIITGSTNTQGHINLDNGYFLQGYNSTSTLKELIGIPAGQDYMRIAGSGEDVHILANTQITGSLDVTAGITGSFFGTSSWAYSASQALTSSYINLLAGPNITINYETNGIAITGSGGGTPGGSDTQIQFNSASVFSGSSNLTFDYVTNQLQLSGSLIVSNSLDTDTRVLYNDLLKTTLDWNNSKLYSNNTSQSIAWDERKLFDINGADAIEYTNTTTSNGVRLYGTASFALTASYVTGSIFTDTNPALSASYAVTASFVPTIKSGVVTTFAGNPRTGSVTFGTPYANANYAVTVTGGTGIARSWTIDSKTSTGFIINSNANTAISGEVNWIAVPYNS